MKNSIDFIYSEKNEPFIIPLQYIGEGLLRKKVLVNRKEALLEQ